MKTISAAISGALALHTQALQRALAQMRSHPISTVLSILVIGVAMMLPLGLHVMFANISVAAARFSTDPTINVYLNVAADTDAARTVETKLRSLSNTAAVTFVPRDVALEDLKRAGQLTDLLAGVEGNPLPHAFVVKPKSLDPATLDASKLEISALPGIETVSMEFEWARKLTRFARFLERMGMVLGLLLAIAVVFVTGNTIRLQILTRRDEIVVARLIGATRRFVRRPFLYFGALQGAAAGIVALGAVAALSLWAGAEVNALAVSYGGEFAVRPPGLEAIAVVLAMGTTLGWLGAALSVSLYWRDDQ